MGSALGSRSSSDEEEGWGEVQEKVKDDDDDDEEGWKGGAGQGEAGEECRLVRCENGTKICDTHSCEQLRPFSFSVGSI